MIYLERSRHAVLDDCSRADHRRAGRSTRRVVGIRVLALDTSSAAVTAGLVTLDGAELQLLAPVCHGRREAARRVARRRGAGGAGRRAPRRGGRRHRTGTVHRASGGAGDDGGAERRVRHPRVRRLLARWHRSARLGRERQPSAVPGLPAQGAAARGIRAQGRARQAAVGLLAELGGEGRRCRIPSFVELSRRISKHRAAIDAALDHRLSNGLFESTNTKIRLLTRMAFGFKSPEAMIALAMLNLGGYCPPLPGRQAV